MLVRDKVADLRLKGSRRWWYVSVLSLLNMCAELQLAPTETLHGSLTPLE